MAEARYLISDAARKVEVETHVLRYWEDELELAIPRNDMGHRYYTDTHIRLFCQIRDLKNRGYQLKAIKNALSKMAGAMEDITITEDLMEEDMKAAWKETKQTMGTKEDLGNEAGGREKEAGRERGPESDTVEIQDDADKSAGNPGGAGNPGDTALSVAAAEEIQVLTPEEKMARFQEIMNHIIGQAVEANMARVSREITEDVSDAVSENVTDRVMKEVEYLLRVSDEKEEERFKQLDETIRAYQNKGKGRAEAAATKTPFFRRKRFGRSGKKLF